VKIAKWVGARWFRLAENSILVLIAVLCWSYWQPSLAETRSLAPGWIAEIYVRNLLLMILVAGGLHLFFYRWRRQGDTLRYDTQELKRNRSRFTFGSQLRDNVFWTLGSGVFFWTAYEVLMFWAMAPYGSRSIFIGCTAGCIGRPSTSSPTPSITATSTSVPGRACRCTPSNISSSSRPS
jgi:hypothetical protein